MDRHQRLADQLVEANDRYKEAKEIEELSRKHLEINSEIRDKVVAVQKKDLLGQTDSHPEQEEIDNLSREQEEIFQQLVDKIKKRQGY